MRKNVLTLVLSGALILGGGATSIGLAHAADNGGSKIPRTSEQKAAHHQKLLDKAKKLEISTANQTDKQLRKAIHKAHKQKRQEHLMKRAEKLGIDVKKIQNDSSAGEATKNIRKAVKEKVQAKKHDRLVKHAKKLGLNTAGKTNQQIRDEIKSKK